MSLMGSCRVQRNDREETCVSPAVTVVAAVIPGGRPGFAYLGTIRIWASGEQIATVGLGV